MCGRSKEEERAGRGADCERTEASEKGKKPRGSAVELESND